MISFTVNGRDVMVDTLGARRLLDVLRDDLKLVGTKEGCGEGECGACSVMIDGQVVNSCLVAVGQVAGSAVITVEGLETEACELSELQGAFIDHGSAQCGICTPGMLIAAHALLENNPSPTYEEVQVAIAGNLCRCTGYTKIIDAVLACRRQVI